MSRMASDRVAAFRFPAWAGGLALICVVATDARAISEAPEPGTDDAVPGVQIDQPLDDDRDIQGDAEPVASGGGGGTTCSGTNLPTCGPTVTGPSCAYPCDGGSPCSFRYYCHGDYDERVLAAIKASRGPVAAEHVIKDIGGTGPQFRTATQRLLSRKKIKRIGKARGTRYLAT